MKSIKFDSSSILLFRVFFGCFILFEVCWTFCFNFNSIFEVENGVWGSFFLEKYIDAYSPVNPLFYLITTNFQLKAYIAVVISLIILYVLGYFPKIISIFITILLGALYAKYNILLSGWPQYMLCILFLTSFIIEKSESQHVKQNSWYEYALLFQIGFIYFFNAISKNGPNWLDGSAIEVCFRYFPLTTYLGDKMLNFPSLLKIFTYGSLFFEVIILFMVMFFFHKKWVRYFIAFGLVLFHVGTQMTMNVGHFYWVVICIAILIMPLNSLMPNSIIQHRFLALKKISIVFVSNNLFHKIIAAVYFYCIVVSNVYQFQQQLCRSNKTDFDETVISKLYPDKINYLPFFYQYWHFFAPNPPSKAGVISYVGVTSDNTSFLIYNGKRINYSHYTGLNKYLSTYIALKDFNIKDKLFIESSLRQQFKLWNADPGNPRLVSFSMFEFYKVRYIDQLTVDALKNDNISRSLKLNFELKYK